MSEMRQGVHRFGLRRPLVGSGIIVLIGVATMVGVYYRGGDAPAPAAPFQSAQVVPVAAPHGSVAPAASGSAASAPASVGAAPTAPARSGIAPSFDIVRVSPQGSAVLAGTAAPDQPVIVRDGTAEIGHTTADHAGQWVMTPDKPLAPGAQELTLASRAPDGAETGGQGSVLLVVPDQGAPKTQTTLAVLTPARSGADVAPRVLQGPAAAPAAGGKPASLDLDVIDYDDHGAVTFAGHAPPDTHVQVYVDNVPVAGAASGAQDRWAVTPGTVTAGQHRVRVDEMNAQGKVVSRVELPFVRETMSQQALAAGHVIVQPGENLWRLARHAYGSGGRYTVIYAYNSSQIRNPALIYPGQAFVIPDAAATASIASAP